LDKIPPIIFLGNKGIPAQEWGGRLAVAVIFPEKESVALANLGWQVILRELLWRDEFVVERFWGQARNQDSLFSIDQKKHLRLFPVWAFSLNFELDLLNVARFLDKAGLDLDSKKRDDFPLIIGGGPLCFLNPGSFLPLFDFLWVGEGEQKFVQLLLQIKDKFFWGASKKELVAIAEQSPHVLSAQKLKAKRFISSFKEPAYSLFVSKKSVFADSLLLEINRGCLYGCRFCAAGYIYRPFRESSVQRLKEIIKEIGPRKVGLVGTSLTDWPELKNFLVWLMEQKIKFSLSSLRMDGLDDDLLSLLRQHGTRTITIAVEGISHKIRRAINKRFSLEKFWQVVDKLAELNYNVLKLYFILGFNLELEDDFAELENFFQRLDRERKGINLIQVSVSCLVPKPWTPLQWMVLDDVAILEEKVNKFKKIIKPFKGIRISTENPILSRVQTILALGDTTQGFTLLKQALADDSWIKAYKKIGKDLEQDLWSRPKDTSLPWEVIDIGISRDYLWKEFLRFKNIESGSKCIRNCIGCKRCGLDFVFN